MSFSSKYYRKVFADLPLAMQGFLLTLVLGVVLGVVLGRIHVEDSTSNIRHHFFKELEERTKNSRIRLDSHIKRHQQAAKLMTSLTNFTNYVQQVAPMADGSNILHKHTPPWFPDRSIQRTFIKIRWALLIDRQNRIRESYGSNRGEISTGLSQHILQRHGAAALEESWILFQDNILYQITSRHFSAGAKLGWNRLVTVSVIDDSFLLASQGLINSDDLLGLLDVSSGKVLVSGNLDKIPLGAKLPDLKGEYIYGSEAFFDYGNSQIILQLVQLAPIAELERLTANVTSKALQEMVLVSLVFASGFSLVLFWFLQNIKQFTVDMLEFSRSEVGIELPAISDGGPLLRMRKQFQVMGEHIIRARDKELQSNRELMQINNKLKESLTMVERAHNQLAQSEKMVALGSLVAGVAHEINTPLGIGYTSVTHLNSEAQETARLYRQGSMTRKDFEVFLDVATESCTLAETNLKRAAELVRSFKLVAVDQTSAEMRTFNIKTYLNEVLLSLRPKLKNRNYSVTITCPDDLVITSFPGSFSQILTNLVINSLEHAFLDRDHGKIAIVVAYAEELLKIIYRDDGRGMSPKVVKHIYEPFFTTARGRGGSGLGMNMVYNLVTSSLGGQIQCDSVLGVETVFTITIPIVDGKHPWHDPLFGGGE